VMVKALAPGLKMMLSTTVCAEIETSVVFETAKVAMWVGALGTVFGIQFAAVFQSPLVGFELQAALPA
jgi:hypothetical protein